MEDVLPSIAAEIMLHPRFVRLRTLRHHGAGNSVYDHSVAVAKAAYGIACRMRLSAEETASVVRAALLHDFFGYDWHGAAFRRYLRRFSGLHRVIRMHAFAHGPIAAQRADQVFHLTDREREAIARHMFPLAAMPRSRIAWIVTLADKAVAAREMTAALGGYLCAACRWVTA
ncbi:MAG: HD domain-containing protein [Eubacteriales bacterium]|nr:HD domain-containing protein [Eubacteriales bacterium]